MKEFNVGQALSHSVTNGYSGILLITISVDCFGMQSIYITRIAVNGLAEKDDRLRPGDKLIQVRTKNFDSKRVLQCMLQLTNKIIISFV